MLVWRLIKTRYASSAFDGEGGRKYGGRWNSVGVSASYASDSAALAVLEVLVHLKDTDVPGYSLVSASIPDSLIEDIDKAALPADWYASAAALQVQSIGDKWLLTRSAVALRVPTVIVPHGKNMLLNPVHPESGRISVLSIEPFVFDQR